MLKAMPSTIAFYVSAHGFGHWAQVAPVIDRLQHIYPSLRLLLRSTLPEREVHKRLSQPIHYCRHTPVDVGVIQHSAIEEDMSATLKALQRFHADWDRRVATESAWLQAEKVDLVVSDIAPLAFAAAAAADIRSLALGSLDWHEIYRPFIAENDPVMQHIAAAYRAADALLKLPLSMDMAIFLRQHPIGLIGRQGAGTRKQAETCLFGDVPRQKTALIMFGGSGTPAFDVQALGEITSWRFLLVAGHRFESWPSNVHTFDPVEVPVPDAMQAADVVICKPGYGTLAEAWLSATPLCFVPREGFPEYPFLRDWLQQQAPAVLLPLSKFVDGAWLPFLEQALAHPRRYPALPQDGSIEASEIIASMANGECRDWHSDRLGLCWQTMRQERM